MVLKYRRGGDGDGLLAAGVKVLLLGELQVGKQRLTSTFLA